ncbi:MAG: ATP-binding cassette domain-containing protein [Oscillospiraceae bacterium]|nr:ATP-binding cassette domain-containing protein [Oscillospiraceae bacterium]
MAFLALSHVSFTYPQAGSAVLRDVSFSLEKGEFAVLCGATGSGKSTLLRMLKRELTPLGTLEGSRLFRDTPLESLDDLTAASAVGFVMQQPEQQIVTDKVWHELAFGLENLGLSQGEMARRIAETASYFGIGDWFERPVSTLSGGQKQLLNLASILVMQPEVLLLDEPTAQLDPIAASEFLTTLRRLNEDLGLTILIAEHRLEELVPLCSRMLVMQEGRIAADGAPAGLIQKIRDVPGMLEAMPAACRIHAALSDEPDSPLTVRDGRHFIESHYPNTIRSLPAEKKTLPDEAALTFENVWFRYDRKSSDILRGMELHVRCGEIFCILGGNGSGKSTTLRAAAGLLRPYQGTIRIFGKKLREYRNQTLYKECLAMLPQDVQTVFLMDTVREELEACHADPGMLPFDLSDILEQHPYDLSGGQQQMAALAKVLAPDPKLLLLDEPTKGMDAGAKQQFTMALRQLQERGVTVVIVTHDVEFAAACADRCAMCFGGQIVSAEAPEHFFSEHMFYTTAVSRMTRGYFDRVIHAEQAVRLCQMNGGRSCS